MSNPNNPIEVRKLIPAFLEDLNRQLRDPTGLVAAIAARVWRYLFLVFIMYLWAFGLMGKDMWGIVAWLASFLAFILLLEYIRITRDAHFNNPIFRWVKLLADIAFISCVVALAADAKVILIIFYVIPILISIVYYPESVSATVLVLFFSVVGFIMGNMARPGSPALGELQVTLFILGLSVVTLLLYRLPQAAILGPAQLSDIAGELSNIIDLGDLVRKAADVAVRLSDASRVLILVVDPEHLNCIGYTHPGLRLRTQEGFTITDVVEQCFHSGTNRLIDASNLLASFESGFVYKKYFDRQFVFD